jgi:hypothetical protein
VPNFAESFKGRRYFDKRQMLEAFVTPTMKGTPDALKGEERVTFFDRNDNRPIDHQVLTPSNLEFYGGLEGYLKDGPYGSKNWKRFADKGLVPSFARGERYMGSSSVAINARGLLDELARDERRALIKLMEGATIPDIASEMNLSVSGASTLLENAKKSYATKYNLAKAGKLASGGIIPNYAIIPGVSQAIGRILTNTVSPFSYSLGDKIGAIKNAGVKGILRALIKDKSTGYVSDSLSEDLDSARMFPYRKMFGLSVSKAGSDIYIPNKDGTYSFNESNKTGAKLLRQIRGSSFSTNMSGDKIEFTDVSEGIAYNSVLGKFYKRIDEKSDRTFYEDKWDFAANSKEENPKLKGLFRELKDIYKSYRENRSLVGDDSRKRLYSRGESLSAALSTNLSATDTDFSKLARKLIGSITSPITIKGETGLYGPLDNPWQIFNGLIPNFNALSDAISRENRAGINLSQIRVGHAPQLANGLNPLGLGVYNTRDEPMGLKQGINRAIRENINPKVYGTTKNIPNFALDPTTFDVGLAGAGIKTEVGKQYIELARQVESGLITARDAIKKFSEIAIVIPKDVERINASFRGLQDVFRNLEKNKLLSNVETIQKAGGIYPTPQQNPQQFFANVGGVQNVLAPQFAQLRKEAIEGERQQKITRNEYARYQGTLAFFPPVQSEVIAQQKQKRLQQKLAENRARLAQIEARKSGLSLSQLHYQDPGELPLFAGSPISPLPYSPLSYPRGTNLQTLQTTGLPNPLRLIQAPNYGNLINPSSFGRNTPGFNTPEQIAEDIKNSKKQKEI